MQLHQFLITFPNIRPLIKFRIPFYYGKTWICYLFPRKKGGVELCFSRGVELSNANGLLEARGRKQVMGVMYHKASEIDFMAIEETMSEAMLLDSSVKYRHPKLRK